MYSSHIPCWPAVPTEFQVDVIIYDAMLLAPVIYNMRTGVNASHIFLCNNLYRIRWALVHHRFRIRLIIRVHCIIKMASTWNSVGTALIVELHTLGAGGMYS